MVSAIGAEGAVFIRRVEPAAPVGPRSSEPRAAAGVFREDGSSLSAPARSPESLTLDKLRLLDRLRGAYEADAPSQPGAAATEDGLSEEELKAVEQLKARDREVRAHEQAHAAVGGPYAGAPRFSYQVGPDGVRYAIGGEVAIDVSPVPDDPEATIEKMRIVERAALAPAEPSQQDLRVAQIARTQALEARLEAAQEKRAEARGALEEAFAAAMAERGYDEAGEATMQRRASPERVQAA